VRDDTAKEREDGLDALSSQRLHDMAMSRARRHVDVKFFYHLMQVLPQAEAGAGQLEDAENDVQSIRAHLDDLTNSGRGEVADLLRPFYIDYLRSHGVKAT
jgi:hypothetical protein